MPQINLVSMIDVLMTVLTFFVIMAMNLTGGVVPNVTLPELDAEGTSSAAATPPGPPPPELSVGLDAAGQIILDGNVIDFATLEAEMTTFLATETEGVVKVKADRGLKYQDVDSLLVQLAEVGGDRVLLMLQK
ncbi:MAG: biopolymer transporter ExbD [Oscillatoriales cyanobacterium]|jgi:biopolymer transport protein ExbD|nr:MAG: biopolymer transporter ExbD [Oscillatoriales cyanobacterium]